MCGGQFFFFNINMQYESIVYTIVYTIRHNTIVIRYDSLCKTNQ